MSKKVYVLGDCHVSRVQEHYDKNKSSVDFVFWGKAAKKTWNLNFEEMTRDNELSSGKEWQEFQGDGVVPFTDILDDGIVFAWFGYVDIRTFLTNYDNSEQVVQNYINQLKNKFKNSKVFLIEPLPQFTEMILKYEGISPYYTHEERLNQNKKFLGHLHDYAKKNNIEIIITQEEILNCLGVRELVPSMTHNKAPHPVDGLKDEYNKKLFDLFEEKAKLVLSND